MSKKWLWLTKVWAEYKVLIITGIIVVAVSVWGCYYLCANQAQVPVLCVTAVVVAWYANEACRLATSTERMASAAWRPNVVLFVEQDKTPNMDIITNDGPGPARELGIVANHPDGPESVSRYVSPNRPVPISHEVEKLLEWAKAGENDRCVSLCWCDIHGQWLHLQWRYTDGRWVCQGSAPDADCDVWRDYIEALKAAN